MRCRPTASPSQAFFLLVLLALCTPAALFAQDKPSAAQAAPAAAAAKSPAEALGVFVYPKNQQTSAQQQKDESECYGWAREQTGFDPSAPADSTSKQAAATPKGGAVKGAARGAAAGTAIGAINDDAGQGAAVGATAGAIRGRRAQKKAGKQAEKQAKADAQAAQQQQVQKFRNAFSACLDARQYSVK